MRRPPAGPNPDNLAIQARKAATLQFGPVSAASLTTEFGEASPRDNEKASYTIARQSMNRVTRTFVTNNPEMDLRNVMAGHHAFDDTEPQDTSNITQLHAIPVADEALDQTAVGKLFGQAKEKSHDDFARRIGIRADSSIFSRTIHDTAVIGNAYQYIQDHTDEAYQVYTPFNQLLTYFTLKERERFDAAYPTKIEPDDSPEIINQKIKERNAAFKAHMQNAKATLNKALNADASTFGRRADLSAIDSAVEYTNKAFTQAGKFHGDMLTQRAAMATSFEDTVTYLRNSLPEHQLRATRHDLETAETKLDGITESITNPQERAAFKWAVEDRRLEATWQRTRSPADQQRLTQHRQPHDATTNPTGKPADYNQHKDAIAPKLRSASTTVDEIIRCEKQIDILSKTQPSIEMGRRDNQISGLEAQVKAIVTDSRNEDLKNHQLNPARYPDPPADLEAYENVVTLRILEKQADQLAAKAAAATPPHQEGLQAAARNAAQVRDDFFRANEHDSGLQRNTPHANGDIERLTSDIAELHVDNIVTATTPGVTLSQDARDIANARQGYESTLSSLGTLLKAEQDDTAYQLENSHPEFLRNLQAQADTARMQYKQAVDVVHQRAGTKETLDRLSAPLDALRATSTGLFSAKSQSNARLERLDPSKFQFALRGGTLPRVLQRLDAKNVEINAILERREILERAVESDPRLAETNKAAIAKNESELRTAVTELTQLTNAAHQSGYLATHPDIGQWAQRAAALHDATNRSKLRNRHRWADRAAGFAQSRPIPKIFRLLAGRDAPAHNQHVQGIQSGIQYDPNAAKALETTYTTTYNEQKGMFQWETKEHKAKITQADGSEKMENIQFSKAELMEHLNDFCEKEGLIPGKDVKITERNGHITFTWPHLMNPKEGQPRDKWLKFTETKYTERRTAEVAEEREANQAEVHVDRGADRDDAIAARALTL